MGKLQLISQLADQTAHAVTRDVDGWKRYLTTASRLYKYSFDEQLLIYAQRPDATACAEMELWNNTMHRWVKAGSKGIAVIRQNGGRPRQAAEFEAFARALENGDQELCTRMQDTTIAVSRVLTVARRSAGIRFPCDR